MKTHWLFTSAVVLALATPAWGQTTDQPTTTPPPAEEMGSQPSTQPEGTAGTDLQTQPEAAEPAAGTAGPEQTIIPEQAETEILAEDLMGTDVFGPDGEQVGDVEDLIFDEQQKVTGVVVGVGGFLGIGKKEVGLNWEQAKIVENADTGTKTITIGLTKAELEAAPDFKTKAEREAEEQAAQQQQQMQEQQMQQPQTVPPTQPTQ